MEAGFTAVPWDRLLEGKAAGGDGEAFNILTLGGSVATPVQGLSGEVLMVRNFQQLEALGDEAKGKIIFFNRPMPRAFLNTFMAYGDAVPQRSNGPIEAARVGGIAAIVRSMTTSLDDFPHTGMTHYSADVPAVPAAAISTMGAERLAKLLKEGPVRLRLLLSCETLPDKESANVVGDLPGTSKAEEIVLIGAHLDGWDIGQAAHDDGCGVIHCLEAVRLIQAAGIKPKRTIRVVLYMNEENGVRGGPAYVEDHLAEMHLHHAAIESDRGGLDPRGFTTTARGEAKVAYQRKLDHLRPMDMGVLLPGHGGVDITFLEPHGVTLFGLFPSSQRYFDFHHSDRDRVEEVNERELALGCAAMAYLTSILAEE